MKIVYILLHLLYLVTCECSYFKAGIQYYCEECCYWYDGDWYCESYGFCYTSVSIIIAAWTFICLAYLTLFFHSKKKTTLRIAQINDLAVQAQREMVKEKTATQQTDNTKEQYEVFSKPIQNLEISNDQL